MPSLPRPASPARQASQIQPSIDPEVVASTPPQMTTSSERDLPGREAEAEGEGSSQKENVPVDAPTEIVAGEQEERWSRGQEDGGLTCC